MAPKNHDPTGQPRPGRCPPPREPGGTPGAGVGPVSRPTVRGCTTSSWRCPPTVSVLHQQGTQCLPSLMTLASPPRTTPSPRQLEIRTPGTFCSAPPRPATETSPTVAPSTRRLRHSRSSPGRPGASLADPRGRPRRLHRRSARRRRRAASAGQRLSIRRSSPHRENPEDDDDNPRAIRHVALSVPTAQTDFMTARKPGRLPACRAVKGSASDG